MQVDVNQLLNELQQVRADKRAYQSHKETVAYTALALSFALSQFTLTQTEPLLVGLAICALCINHMFVRWTLWQRRKASAFHWETETAITRTLFNDLMKSDLSIYDPKAKRRAVLRRRRVRRSKLGFIRLFVGRCIIGESITRESLAHGTSSHLMHKLLWGHCKRQERMKFKNRAKRVFSGSFQGSELPTFASLFFIAYTALQLVKLVKSGQHVPFVGLANYWI